MDKQDQTGTPPNFLPVDALRGREPGPHELMARAAVLIAVCEDVAGALDGVNELGEEVAGAWGEVALRATRHLHARLERLNESTDSSTE